MKGDGVLSILQKEQPGVERFGEMPPGLLGWYPDSGCKFRASYFSNTSDK